MTQTKTRRRPRLTDKRVLGLLHAFEKIDPVALNGRNKPSLFMPWTSEQRRAIRTAREWLLDEAKRRGLVVEDRR